jgi:Lon protease-like protein
MQSFDQLPDRIPIYRLENALLPGGELPVELSKPVDLALFLHALRNDQLIGMVQPRHANSAVDSYSTGCAGRIRQYRERKDGRLNIMLTGLCRYRIVEKEQQPDGYPVARVDWRGFENDLENERVEAVVIENFKHDLRSYFERFQMQVDWEVLDKLPIEQVVNNLVLIVNLDRESKQLLLEACTVAERLRMFSALLKGKETPIQAASPQRGYVN